MGDGVDVDGVGRGTPGLDLLGDSLGVWEGENTYFSGGAEGVGETVQEVGDRLGDVDGSENAGSEAGVTAEGVEEGVVWSFDVGMDPGNVGELLDSEFTDGSFVTCPYPFQGQMVARRVERERRREGPKAAFGQAPEKGISFQVKGGAFSIGVGPRLGKPSDVPTGRGGVGN